MHVYQYYNASKIKNYHNFLQYERSYSSLFSKGKKIIRKHDTNKRKSSFSSLTQISTLQFKSALPPNVLIFEPEPERRCPWVNSPVHHTANDRLWGSDTDYYSCGTFRDDKWRLRPAINLTLSKHEYQPLLDIDWEFRGLYTFHPAAVQIVQPSSVPFLRKKGVKNKGFQPCSWYLVKVWSRASMVKQDECLIVVPSGSVWHFIYHKAASVTMVTCWKPNPLWRK